MGSIAPKRPVYLSEIGSGAGVQDTEEDERVPMSWWRWWQWFFPIWGAFMAIFLTWGVNPLLASPVAAFFTTLPLCLIGLWID